MERVLTCYVGSIEDAMEHYVLRLGYKQVYKSDNLGIVQYKEDLLLKFEFWPEDPVEEIVKQDVTMWDAIKARLVGVKEESEITEEIKHMSDVTVEEFFDYDDDDKPPKRFA